MTGTALGVLLVCIVAAIEGFSQLALKIAASGTPFRFLWIAGGVALFIFTAIVYSAALRYLDVSVAYAIESLGFISVTVLSKWLLHEHVTPVRWLGVLLILVGVTMIVAQA
jgi:multidrug transporter EmrE-like cation transporter